MCELSCLPNYTRYFLFAPQVHCPLFSVSGVHLYEWHQQGFHSSICFWSVGEWEIKRQVRVFIFLDELHRRSPALAKFLLNERWPYLCNSCFLLTPASFSSIISLVFGVVKVLPLPLLLLESLNIPSVRFNSVAQSSQTLCDPMDCSTPGFPVHHQLPELTQNPVHRWCHPTISSSVVPFSSFLQYFPASGSFQMSQFFASGGQIFGVSASASVLPMNIQDRFPLGWTGWISLQSKGLSGVFFNTTVQKHQFFNAQLSL